MTIEHLEGSCLCGGVKYKIDGEPTRFYHCHCSRCRKVSGAAHASNLFVKGRLSWEQGEELIRQFKVEKAERFTNTFCSRCGGRLPRMVAAQGMVVLPAGSLDCDTSFAPQGRIFMASRAPWSCTTTSLEEFDEYPG